MANNQGTIEQIKAGNNYQQLAREISAAEFRGIVLTKLEYIDKAIRKNEKSIFSLKNENQDRKDWQEDMDTKIKFSVSIATIIGGAIVFLTERILSFAGGLLQRQ